MIFLLPRDRLREVAPPALADSSYDPKCRSRRDRSGRKLTLAALSTIVHKGPMSRYRRPIRNTLPKALYVNWNPLAL